MEMGIRHALSEVLSRYLSGSLTSDIADEIRGTFPKMILAGLPSSYADYLVKGSAGIGRKAQVPWFGIFDPRITNRAGRGYYLVYLFKTDMTGVYLSLNQAWEPFSRQGGAAIGRENIQKMSERVRSALERKGIVSADIRASIDLALSGRNSDRPRGYEQGHIFGMYYPADSLPDEAHLVADLENMLKLYAGMVDIFKGSAEADPLGAYEDAIEEVRTTDKSLTTILRSLPAKASVSDFKEVEFPGSRERMRKVQNGNHRPFKPDYVLNQKRNIAIGNRGEAAAVELLQQWYPSSKVERVSEEDDSLGYDIRVTGGTLEAELHVEVKATAEISKHAQFFISSNEIEQAKADGDQFMLLRLFGLNSKKPGYYKVTGTEVAELHLTPSSYLVEVL